MACCLGNEPSLEAYVGHAVLVFCEVWRVLRDDATLWINCGDSHCTDAPGGATIDPKWRSGRQRGGDRPNRRLLSGLKHTDLCEVPSRLALALQAHGWYLHSRIPWLKIGTAMPESVDGRPTNATEYVFLFSKNAGKALFWTHPTLGGMRTQPAPDYRWIDHANDDVRTDQEPPAWRTETLPDVLGPDGKPVKRWRRVNLWDGHAYFYDAESLKVVGSVPAGTRNRRNTDWFVDSLRGLLSDDDGDPLAFAVNPKGFAEAHFACVDEETEALTVYGWKRHTQLRDGDFIAAYDSGLECVVWEQALFHRYDYEGELVAIEKRDTSQRLTPNHRCLVRTRHGQRKVVPAEALVPGMEVPTTAPFKGGESLPVGENWAALVGWYIAEGCRHHSGYINIYQSLAANPQHVSRIRDLLISVGAQFSEVVRERPWRANGYHCVTFTVRGDAARMLEELAPEKAMTPELARLPKRDAAALLNALIDGDGHRRPDGRANITQKSKQSIDLMQMLAMRLGYRVLVRQHRVSGVFTAFLTTGRWLTLRGTNGCHTPIPREKYRGTVWCPSVPSTFWVARRNGKPFITGNTWPEALVEPMIRGGTSERGVCPACGAPWVRQVDVERAPRRATVSVAAAIANPRPQGALTTQRWDDPDRKHTTGWVPSCQCCQACDELGIPHIERGTIHATQGSRSRARLAETVAIEARAQSQEERGAQSPSGDMRQVQTTVPREEGAALLQPDMCRQGDVGCGDCEHDVACGHEPLCQPPHTGRESMGAPPCDGGTSGAPTETGRARPSSQREQGRQPHREPLLAQPRISCATTHEPATHPMRPYDPVPAVVLDPFCGSGTTGLVAHKLGRVFAGVELSESYCSMATTRIMREGVVGKTTFDRQAVGQMALSF